MARLDYKKLNSTLRYLMFSVFTVTPGQLGEDRDAVAADLEEFLARYDGTDVVVRGLYDISGLRAEADFMIWTHSEHIEDLQRFYNEFRRTTLLGRASTAFWSNTALHRPAEFNKSHIPAFLAEEEPGAYVSVYPFVRSYEWYLLPDEERRQILAQHGRAAREYPDVRANTVPSFTLGDYEWILAFEAPQLDRIVDLMREMRATEARRHVREEIPFFTGPRVTAGQLAASMP
ncbi:hydrogen peroxide-dependent heme synthase [Dietzia kunjamensis]|uniref:hydrogen peroxide-dependent heme synthase n=1 Tax=Dietzia kunjamensis TaxID=322509 RepID=UPI0020969725|nr:hydrogen peroxide-dependent heme synthase [Dietzia kunjamensis]USX47400.1 chlorite dismutase family protein [Dietzia kunjamensis]